MLFHVCALLLCASTQSLSLGPKYTARSRLVRAGVVRSDAAVGLPKGLSLDTLTEASALALEGDELAAVATELSVYLFRSPPFQEKAEQPKRRMLALVYEKLGIMGKAESCAREVRDAPARPNCRASRSVCRGRSWAAAAPAVAAPRP